MTSSENSIIDDSSELFFPRVEVGPRIALFRLLRMDEKIRAPIASVHLTFTESVASKLYEPMTKDNEVFLAFGQSVSTLLADTLHHAALYLHAHVEGFKQCADVGANLQFMSNALLTIRRYAERERVFDAETWKSWPKTGVHQDHRFLGSTFANDPKGEGLFSFGAAGGLEMDLTGYTIEATLSQYTGEWHQTDAPREHALRIASQAIGSFAELMYILLRNQQLTPAAPASENGFYSQMEKTISTYLDASEELLQNGAIISKQVH